MWQPVDLPISLSWEALWDGQMSFSLSPTMQYHRAAVFKLPVAIGGIHSPDVTVPWGLS